MKNTIQTVNDLIRENSEIKIQFVITPNYNLQNDLGMDSMDVTSLVMDIEKKLELTIDDPEFERVKTVKDLYDLVINKKQSKAENLNKE